MVALDIVEKRNMTVLVCSNTLRNEGDAMICKHKHHKAFGTELGQCELHPAINLLDGKYYCGICPECYPEVWCKCNACECNVLDCCCHPRQVVEKMGPRKKTESVEEMFDQINSLTWDKRYSIVASLSSSEDGSKDERALLRKLKAISRIHALSMEHGDWIASALSMEAEVKVHSTDLMQGDLSTMTEKIVQLTDRIKTLAGRRMCTKAIR